VKTLKTEKVAKIAVLVLLTSVVLIGGGTRPAPAVAEPTGGGRDNCWMTGGGSIFDVEYGGRVTQGFVLHCVPRNSDNLQVVDHVSGQSFHLERLISATCPDDPAIDPNPPDAVFDTFNGMGEGRCKQPDRPCIATWTFTDTAASEAVASGTPPSSRSARRTASSCSACRVMWTAGIIRRIAGSLTSC
jgi:hypothetical protein